MAMASSSPEGFKQAGSIVRLKFINFMQYGDTEFKAGPNLNVIIGPNGSGKSTIVNGICLGLAGKTTVLGRASNLSEFIKLGEQEAMVEVELFVPDGENAVIQRRWRQDNKSSWTVGGRKTTQKEVEAGQQKFLDSWRQKDYTKGGQGARLLEAEQQRLAGQHCGCCGGCRFEGETS